MKEFKAESKKLLDLVINSIYTQKDVFLRELISNASDAYDKLKLIEADTSKVFAKKNNDKNDNASGKQEGEGENKYEIELSYDASARTITISDNGIGMTEEQLEENLGTIAHSSSLELKRQEDIRATDNVDIIGQFGVGFYSCFMVAEKVEVISRAYESAESAKNSDGNEAPEASEGSKGKGSKGSKNAKSSKDAERTAHMWQSDGTQGFTIVPAERASHGTDVILYLRKNDGSFDYDKFLSHSALSELVKRYSDYIRYPIVLETHGMREVQQDDAKPSMTGPEFEEYTERVVLNTMTPIWTRPKSEVSKEDYDNFYMKEFEDANPPLRTISLHARGGHSCDILLFIPSEPAPDFYTDKFEKGLELYSSNVLIQQNCPELLDESFGFLRGIVDSPDISLNLSRETLQSDPFLKAIAAQISKRVKEELEQMRDNERDTYIDFFSKFGRIFKFAIYATFGAKNATLEDLLLFFTANKDMPITLKEYKEGMPESQPAIFYACGESPEKLESSPNVCALTKRGYDVLLCTDSIDEFALKTLREYASVPIKNASDENLGLETQEERAQINQVNAEHKKMFDYIKDVLPNDVVEVSASATLDKLPVCIRAKGSISLGMERYFKNAQQGENAPHIQHVLELNYEHAIFDKLISFWNEKNKNALKRYAIILYGQALLEQDLEIENMQEYVDAIYELMS